MAEAAELGGYGVSYESPTVDLDTLRRKKEAVVDTLAKGLAQLAKRRKIRVIQAWAEFSDSETLRLRPAPGASFEETELRFEHAIIATGSVPTSLPFLRQPTNRVMFSGAALDIPDIPERLLVIGGGYIGLELATVYARTRVEGECRRNDGRTSAGRRSKSGSPTSQGPHRAIRGDFISTQKSSSYRRIHGEFGYSSREQRRKNRSTTTRF